MWYFRHDVVLQVRCGIAGVMWYCRYDVVLQVRCDIAGMMWYCRCESKIIPVNGQFPCKQIDGPIKGSPRTRGFRARSLDYCKNLDPRFAQEIPRMVRFLTLRITL